MPVPLPFSSGIGTWIRWLERLADHRGVFVAAGPPPPDRLAGAGVVTAAVQLRVGTVTEDLVGDLKRYIEEAVRLIPDRFKPTRRGSHRQQPNSSLRDQQSDPP
jgi:hypothetical protein